MRRPLNEQIVRMYSLLYGKNVVNEKLITINEQSDKKADIVTDDVTKFFDNLSKVSTPLSQQKRGQMNFQKDVETVQIGLILLGYPLPRFGVDGLFGPETGRAVNKFISDHLKQLSESAGKLRSTLNDLGYDEKGREISSGGEITDKIATIVSEILTDFKQSNPSVGVVITAGNDKFHHGLSYNSKHKHGKAIDLVLRPYNKTNASAFMKILDEYKSKYPGFNYIDEYTRPTKAATAGHFHLQFAEGESAPSTKSEPEAVVTDEFVKKMYELLKQKNLKPEDIKPYVNQFINTGGGEYFTDLDLTTDEGVRLYALICQTYIETRSNNFLKINGDMLAKAAKTFFESRGKYVPPELALAQLAQEGGFTDRSNAVPITTKNPFNIGNTDSGAKIYYNTVQDGINSYYNWITKSYLVGSKTAADLVQNFVNKNNDRYASSKNYESKLQSLIIQINRIADRIMASNKQ
jgi:hypothetical protein